MRNLFSPEKRVILDLTQIDSNAYSLMGAFRVQARLEGWSDEDINLVLEECKSSDYNNLVRTLLEHTYC